MSVGADWKLTGTFVFQTFPKC